MLERHFSGKLRQLLQNLNEYHLAKILLGAADGPVRSHEFGDERIKLPHQRARGVLILPHRRRHQLA
jgi:hypothetical protein